MVLISVLMATYGHFGNSADQSWPSSTPFHSEIVELQSLGHHDLVQVLLFLPFMQSILLQQRYQRVSLFYHLQHLLQDQTLLHQLPLLLQVVCTRPGHTRKNRTDRTWTKRIRKTRHTDQIDTETKHTRLILSILNVKPF